MTSILATATVKGGFWPTNGVTSLASIDGKSFNSRRILMCHKGKSMQPDRVTEFVLCGAVAGGTAAFNWGEIAAAEDLSGKRAIAINTLINRATTAQDVADIKADLIARMSTKTTFGANPPANKDGNPLGTR